MKPIRTLLTVAAAALTLASCDHKELCYDHRHAVAARVNVDWSLFTEEQPTGMTVTLYPTDGEQPYSTLTNNTLYADLSVPPGTYDAMVYNQSPSEFGTVEFSGMDYRSTATVYAATVSSRWYKTRADNERLVCQPEWIATDIMADVEAPEEESDRHARTQTRCVVATLMPQCVVYTISIDIHIKNIYNVRSARASLDGLADGYRLGAMRATATQATQLIEEWTMTRDGDNPANGTLHASIQSFGLPDGQERLPDRNHLRLSLLLVDNKTQKDYDFAVGDRFVKDEDVRLSLSLSESIDEPLPDVKPDGGATGGFDAKVDDWGEDERIDIGV